MPRLPALDPKTQINQSPHVVILGAGASLASFSKGDANGKSLPLMNNLIDICGLKELIKKTDIEYSGDFESFYDDLISANKYPKIAQEMEGRIYRYFEELTLPETPTIYDYLILGLREKDLIVTFNWDPFLTKAFERNRHITELPQILFLHGNVNIGVCLKHKRKGFINQICSICKQKLQPTQLLYPVKQKDYKRNPFIKNEWDVFKRYLEHAYFVTIFGYSAPVTDIEARTIMLDSWKSNQTLELAEIEIIDIKDREDLEKTWEDFLFSHHYSTGKTIRDSYIFQHPRRSCDAFAMATLQCEPWHENRYPEFDTLKKMQDWVKPLLLEEKQQKFSGNPCS